MSLSKPYRVYESYIFGFNCSGHSGASIHHPAYQCYKCSLAPLPPPTVDTCCSSTRISAKPTLDKCLSGPLCCQSSRPGRIWEDSCPPEPPKGSMTLLSRAYYHPLDPAGLQAQFPSDTVSAIQEKGENWLRSSFKCYDCGHAVISRRFKEPKNLLKWSAAQFLERTQRPWHDTTT